jgi:hypothetical protein
MADRLSRSRTFAIAWAAGIGGTYVLNLFPTYLLPDYQLHPLIIVLIGFIIAIQEDRRRLRRSTSSGAGNEAAAT